MKPVHTPARPQLIDARQLVTRLTALAKKHEEQGRVSHSLGVRSALDLVKRDLAGQKRTDKSLSAPG